jgi:hypothetical protein
MKKTFYFLVLTLLSSQLAFASRAALKEVLDTAQTGNSTPYGRDQVIRYSVESFDKTAELKQMRKRESKACGPWKKTVYRRDGLALMDRIDSEAATLLRAMYDRKEIAAMITTESNNEIECSIAYVKVFSTDGWMLELNYGMGD